MNIGFINLKGNEVFFEDIWKNPRQSMEDFDMSMPKLRALAEERPVDRPPSVTECLNGTLEAYLKRTEDYFIDPQSMIFALAGTLHHQKLEQYGEITEEKWKDYDMTGISDYREWISGDEYLLIDYKNFGSYKVKQILGINYRKIDDPTGAKYKKSGSWGKAGSPKQVKEFYIDESSADFGEVAWQQNMYRIFIENKGDKISKMFIDITVRDGGLQVSRDRGVTQNSYLIEVPYIKDEWVIDFFKKRRDMLNEALNSGVTPVKCQDAPLDIPHSFSETWEGNKCKSYCAVRDICPYMIKND